jgi:hypothetical protein
MASHQQVLKKEKDKGSKDSKDSKDSDTGFPVIAQTHKVSQSTGKDKDTGKGKGTERERENPITRAMHTVQEDFRDVIVDMVHAEEEWEHSHPHDHEKERDTQSSVMFQAEAKDVTHSSTVSVPPGTHGTVSQSAAAGEAKYSPRGSFISERVEQQGPVPSSSSSSSMIAQSPRLSALSPRGGDMVSVTDESVGRELVKSVTPLYALSPIAPLSRQHSLTQPSSQQQRQDPTLTLDLDHCGFMTSSPKVSARRSARDRNLDVKGMDVKGVEDSYGENDFDHNNTSTTGVNENDRTMAWRHATSLLAEEKTSSGSPLVPVVRHRPVAAAKDVDGYHDDEYQDVYDEEEAFYQSPRKIERENETKEAKAGEEEEGKHDYEEDQYYEDEQHQHQHSPRGNKNQAERVMEEQEAGDEYDNADYSADFAEFSPLKGQGQGQEQEPKDEYDDDEQHQHYYEDDQDEQQQQQRGRYPSSPVVGKVKRSNNQEDEIEEVRGGEGEESKYNDASFGDYDEDFD